MAGSSYRLTQNQLNSVLRELEETFYYEIDENGVKVLKININYFEDLIDRLQLKYERYGALLTSKTKVNFSTYKNISLKDFIMAYPLLMKFRQFLTQSEINYRIYSDFKDKNMIISQVGTYDFLRGLKLQATKSGTILNFDISPIRKKQERMDNLENCYNRFFPQLQQRDLTQRFTNLKLSQSRWRVRKFIFNRYIDQNIGLKQKNSNLYQTFNFGHLIEAFDLTFTHILQIDTADNTTFRQVEDIYFGKYLNLDNIKGFHGGDNPMTNTQIKTRRGDVMDLSSVLLVLKNTRNIIKKIKEYLNSGDKNLRQEIKNLLKENFYEEKIEENLNETLELNIEKLIGEFEKVKQEVRV